MYHMHTDRWGDATSANQLRMLPEIHRKGKRKDLGICSPRQRRSTDKKCSLLSKRNMSEIDGFSNDYILPKSRGLCANVVGNSVAPPVVAAVAEGVVKSPQERMRELEGMRSMLTEDEYQAKRAEILSDV